MSITVLYLSKTVIPSQNMFLAMILASASASDVDVVFTDIQGTATVDPKYSKKC